MRIGLDLRMVGGGSGIDRYTTEISHAILSANNTNQYFLFFRNAQAAEDYKKYSQTIVIADIPHYSFAEQIEFAWILRGYNLDLVHFPHFNVPIFYRGKFVVTIHDLTHTLFPGRKKSRFFHRLAYHLVFRNAILSAHKIIAVSQSTKKSIVDHYRLNPNKIQVIYEGTNQTYSMVDKDQAYEKVSNRFGISKPYILYVGVWRRYKNLPTLAQAFDRLVDQGLDYELVLVGSKDPYYPEIGRQIFSIRNHERIKPLERISDEELKNVYNAATLFVLPSLYEGFGLTILEAAACGVPIACSDIPSLREVAGPAAEFFDPANLQNMTDVLKNLLEKPNRLQELANLGLRRASIFSWKNAAEETLEVYKL